MKITLSKAGEKFEVTDVNADIFPGEKADCLVVDGLGLDSLVNLLGIEPGVVTSGLLEYSIRIQGDRDNMPSHLGTHSGVIEIPAGTILEIMLINGDSREGDIHLS